MRTFEDVQFSEIMDMMQNPNKYDLTFGEFMLVAQKVTAIAAETKKITDPNPPEAKDEYLRKKVCKLEKRITELETKIDNMSRARIIFDDGGDDMFI